MKRVILATALSLFCLSAFAIDIEFVGGGLVDLADNKKIGSLIAVEGLQFEGLSANCTPEEMKSISQDSLFVFSNHATAGSLRSCANSNIDEIGIAGISYDRVRLSLSYGEAYGGETVSEGWAMDVVAKCQVEEFVETSLSGFVKYVFTSEIAMSKKLVCRIQENGNGTVAFKIVE